MERHARSGQNLTPTHRAALLVLALALALPGATRAGTEEFSTFGVEYQERDDESLIDHMLTRAPAAWDAEWARAPLAVRTQQGCLTAGQWFTSIDLKARTSMGGRAWFGFDLTQRQDDTVDYQFLDFSFHVPTRWGTPYLMFRPFHDKSRQDFALGWDVGADTSAFELSAVMGLEDMFNNLWSFRQTTLGELAQPYLKHPFEPALRLAVRQPAWNAEVGGRYLTPGTKKIIVSYVFPDLDSVATLWGTYAWGSVSARALGGELTVRAVNHQAESADWLITTPDVTDRNYRRQWCVETIVRRPIAPRWRAEGHWLYQERSANIASPTAPRSLFAVDRALQLEVGYAPLASLSLRAGALHDRVTITQAGTSLPRTEGTRGENRAYFGLALHFGRVSLQGVEGLELDHEPYVVSWIHDKGFLQLQALF